MTTNWQETIGPIGEETDWRNSMLMPLILNGVITADEARKVMDWTDSGDDANTVYGIVAGEFNKTGREVAGALEGTQFATKAKDIEAQKKGYSEWIEGAREIAEGMRGLYDPAHQVANVAKGIFDFGTRNQPTEEESVAREEQKAAAARDQTVMLDAVDEALEQGYITEDDATEARLMLDRWATNPDIERYDEDLWALRDNLQNKGYTGAPELESMRVKGGSARATDDRPEETVEMAAQYAANNRKREEDAEFDPTTTSMADTLIALGEFENVLSLAKPEDLLAAGYELNAEGKIFDRASGAVMSKNMYEILQKETTVREAYKGAKRPTSAVRGLLDKPFFSGRGPQMPVEDIAIPSLLPSEAYEIDPYLYGGKTESIAEWSGMSVRERKMRMRLMADGDMLSEENINVMNFSDPYNEQAIQMWDAAKQLSEVHQVDPIHVLTQQGRLNREANAIASRSRGGGGRVGPTYSVPASLREIPDFKTLAQNTKALAGTALGRDLEDWEVSLLSDELKDEHITANEQRIAIHKQAWDEAISGGSVDVDFTGVEDPNKALSYDIEEMYGSEIARNERVDDRANSRRLLMDSISMGQRMI